MRIDTKCIRVFLLGLGVVAALETSAEENFFDRKKCLIEQGNDNGIPTNREASNQYLCQAMENGDLLAACRLIDEIMMDFENNKTEDFFKAYHLIFSQDPFNQEEKEKTTNLKLKYPVKILQYAAFLDKPGQELEAYQFLERGLRHLAAIKYDFSGNVNPYKLHLKMAHDALQQKVLFQFPLYETYRKQINLSENYIAGESFQWIMRGPLKNFYEYLSRIDCSIDQRPTQLTPREQYDFYHEIYFTFMEYFHNRYYVFEKPYYGFYFKNEEGKFYFAYNSPMEDDNPRQLLAAPLISHEFILPATVSIDQAIDTIQKFYPNASVAEKKEDMLEVKTTHQKVDDAGTLTITAYTVMHTAVVQNNDLQWRLVQIQVHQQWEAFPSVLEKVKKLNQEPPQIIFHNLTVKATDRELEEKFINIKKIFLQRQKAEQLQKDQQSRDKALDTLQ